MNKIRHRSIGLLLALAGWVTALPASANFLDDVAALTRHPHRLSGTPEFLDAVNHVERRLRAIGVDDLIIQEFPSVQTVVLRCDMMVGDTAVPLIPARPNGIIPPSTPPHGITGELIGPVAATADVLPRLSVEGRIVVMSYNAGLQWYKAFRLGARAVIFVDGHEGDSEHHHYVRSNANLPRYYYQGSREDLPFGQTVTLHAEITWERTTGRNIIALIEGTDPIFDLGREEVVIMAANLDSFGDFPRATPGARSAANAAGLLDLAQSFAERPPRRHIVLAFFDNQARSHAGAIEFYWALESRIPEATIATRLESWQLEVDFLQAIQSILDRESPLDHLDEDGGRRLEDRLNDKARDLALNLRGELMEMREALDALDDEDPEIEAQRTELSARIDAAQGEFDLWNDLRRAFRRSYPITSELAPLRDRVLQHVRDDVARRRAELTADESMLLSSKRIFDLLGERWITLHASLLLGDSTAKWGVLIGGDSEIRNATLDQPGLYGRVQQSFLRAYDAQVLAGNPARNFERATVDATLTQPRLLWAARGLIHSGEVSGRYGIYNIALGTTHESLPREGTPADTVDQLNLDVIATNIAEIAGIMTALGNLEGQVGEVEAVADQRGLSLRRVIGADYSYLVPRFRNQVPEGSMAMGRHRGSSIPNLPVRNAVIQVNMVQPWNSIFWPHNKYAAFDPFQVVMTDQNGAYTIGGLAKQDSWPQATAFAARFDARGVPNQVSDMRSIQSLRTRLNMVRARGGFLLMPPRFWPDNADVLDAVGNANLGNDPSERGFVENQDGVVAFFVENKVSDVKVFGEKSAIALDNTGVDLRSSNIHEPLGRGFPIDGNWLDIRPSFQGAGDLWRLNESRLSLLRSKDILNSSLEELHGRVEDLLSSAERMDQPLHGEALAAAALLSAQPVYENVRSITDDLITAVLILLALCIPFAFALERLLIGASLIYKQVSWFAVFFIITFIVLYLSHPAFAVAQTPIIIFLGFAVVVLASLVIFIIMQKFELELKTIQGMTSTVHANDVSRFNTIMAAMSMGISTMRRRPLRTALTAITIVLLTFTILCFASFDTQRGIVRFFVSPTPNYTGVLYHPPSWGTINPDFVELLRARWDRSRADVATRHWVCPEFPGDPDFVVGHADGSNPVTLKGILGLEVTELRHRPDLRALLGIEQAEDILDKVFMTDAVADLLGVQPGDPVIVKGLRLTVGPILSSTRFGAVVDMDNTSIIPIDYAQMQDTQAQQSTGSAEDLLTEQGNWANLPTDSVVVMADALCARVGGKVSVVHIYTEDAEDAAIFAEDFARMMDRTPIVATRKDGVYRHIQGTVVAASGVSDLLFPIFLGALVIFGTMLGSVADREKEIYTFSALGLAPPHVASLFFAEALVFSVLGGMGGYLIAQGTMKILTLLAAYGLVQVPEMNYSSTNAIVTILIVMATVLVSAIYPAIKASKSANPGLLRTWKPPAPKGDVYDLVFPFTVSEYDLTGVVSFLQEHFNNFSDTGLGTFMARDTKMVRYDDGSLGLKAYLALAPFDLGVTQDFELKSAPSEIKGIDEVNIRLVRRSGQPGDWLRLNRNLFNDLRTQFLLWRSLPKETMEHYRQQTLVALKQTTVAL